MKEKCLIVGAFSKHAETISLDRRMNEMKLLAETANLDVFETIIQKIEDINPATFIGKGKVEEVAVFVQEFNIDLVIMSIPLSPVQLRNLESEWKTKVIDRNELILDIFAKNAKTNISKIETELAQYSYMLPRLTGKGILMSRTGGGIGTRGPGEKKLELDRRKILNRVDILKRKLSKYSQDNEIRYKNRENIFTVSLLGYTNAGKSTIMNYLTNNNVIVRDQMFTTLDTTSRRLYRDIVLTDTVGFLGELPHELIQSFELTLSEAIHSNLKLVITDISDPYAELIISDVNNIMNSLDGEKSDIIYVFNKTDMTVPGERMNHIKELYANALFISAKSGYNMELLRKMIIDKYLASLNCIRKLIPYSNSDEINYLISHGIINMQNETEDGMDLDVYLKQNDYAEYKKYYELEEK